MPPNILKWPEMFPNDSKIFQMAQNNSKRLQMARNSSPKIQIHRNGYKMLQKDFNSNLVGMSPNESKWVQTCLHRSNWFVIGAKKKCQKVLNGAKRY